MSHDIITNEWWGLDRFCDTEASAKQRGVYEMYTTVLSTHFVDKIGSIIAAFYECMQYSFETLSQKGAWEKERRPSATVTGHVVAVATHNVSRYYNMSPFTQEYPSVWFEKPIKR